MFTEERQQAMAQLVAEHGRLSVRELAERYEVAVETVRRDLSVLERMGLVRRVHGGVLPGSSRTNIEIRLLERDCQYTETEERIARAALEFLPPVGSTVIMDAGSTTSRLASILPLHHRLVVFTHAIPTAVRLTRHPQVELHLLPGHVRPTTTSAVGADTVAALGDLRVDAVFISATALSLGHGLSAGDHDEAAINHAIVRSARQVFVMCDASKLGQDSLVRFARVADVDVLITDAAIDKDERAAYARAGVNVVIANR